MKRSQECTRKQEEECSMQPLQQLESPEHSHTGTFSKYMPDHNHRLHHGMHSNNRDHTATHSDTLDLQTTLYEDIMSAKELDSLDTLTQDEQDDPAITELNQDLDSEDEITILC